MITIEKTEVFGFEAAIRGCRNPYNSWDKSDSKFHICAPPGKISYAEIGEADLKLMKSLSKAGTDHSKFLRMINVTLDITAPLYWWKEFDTYKVGTVANSCSTMHKIHAKEFTEDDFSHDKLIEYGETKSFRHCLSIVIDYLNFARDRYLECTEKIKANNFEDWNEGLVTKERQKEYWWQMIQLLPSSYNQRRTVQLNYQVLKSLYPVRKAHKLDEWVEFCKWCESLPYFKEICIEP